LHDKRALCFPLDGLAKTSFALEKSEKGKEYCRELISLANSTGSRALVALAYGYLADQYLKEQRIDSSLYYAKNAISIAGLFNSRKGLDGVYRILIKDFQLIHQKDSAFAYQSKLLNLKDTLFAENNRSQLESFAFEEEMQEKERADAIQKATEAYQHQQDKMRNRVTVLSLLAGLFVVGVIGLILHRNNLRKQKANKLLQKQKEQIQATLAELKNTQTQLIQQEKMASLGELTAGIAHEIQNPLNFVNNFSEVSTELVDEMEEALQKNDREEALAIAGDLKDNLQKINHHGKRADAIVKGMLQHSRANTGKKEPTNINALADEYLRLSYHGLRAKDKDFNADFTTDFDESISEVEVVPQDIGRVLLNLYNNAFYAVNEKKKLLNGNFEPTVSVNTKRSGDKIEILVKDNGVGVPQKVVDKIFQPFFTTKPTGQGTGLGLSLSYDIVKAHRGDLKVATKEGEGSEFIIQIPE
jgi:signal transduction histidine kinase